MWHPNLMIETSSFSSRSRRAHEKLGFLRLNTRHNRTAFKGHTARLALSSLDQAKGSTMPVYRPPKIATSEITPHAVYLQRREFLAAGAFGAMSLLSARGSKASPLSTVPSIYKVDQKPTPREDVTTYCPSSNDLRRFGLWKNGVSGSVCGLI